MNFSSGNENGPRQRFCSFKSRHSNESEDLVGFKNKIKEGCYEGQMYQDANWDQEGKETGPHRFIKGDQMNAGDFHYCYNLVFDPSKSYQEKLQEILQNKKYASALQLFLTGNYVNKK